MIWQHTLSTTLKFDIEQDTLGLLPKALKLVVMQHVIPNDLDGNPSNPCLGAVYLKLAECQPRERGAEISVERE